jgi:hypothetical protein
MTNANQFTIDTGRGYQITGRAEADGDLPGIVLSRAGQQPSATGQTGFPVTLSIEEDLT